MALLGTCCIFYFSCGIVGQFALLNLVLGSKGVETRWHFKFEEDGLDKSLLKGLNKTLSTIINHFEAQNCIMGDRPHINHIKLWAQSTFDFPEQMGAIISDQKYVIDIKCNNDEVVTLFMYVKININNTWNKSNGRKKWIQMLVPSTRWLFSYM